MTRRGRTLDWKRVGGRRRRQVRPRRVGGGGRGRAEGGGEARTGTSPFITRPVPGFRATSSSAPPASPPCPAAPGRAWLGSPRPLPSPGFPSPHPPPRAARRRRRRRRRRSRALRLAPDREPERQQLRQQRGPGQCSGTHRREPQPQRHGSLRPRSEPPTALAAAEAGAVAAAEAPLQLRLPLASRELQVPGGLAAGGDRKRRVRHLEAGSGLGGGSGAAAEGPGVWRDRERRELRLGVAAVRWRRPWPSSTILWNVRFAMRSPNTRNLPRSAKAHSGKIRPRGAGSSGPILSRADVVMSGARVEVARKLVFPWLLPGPARPHRRPSRPNRAD